MKQKIANKNVLFEYFGENDLVERLNGKVAKEIRPPGNEESNLGLDRW